MNTTTLIDYSEATLDQLDESYAMARTIWANAFDAGIKAAAWNAMAVIGLEINAR